MIRYRELDNTKSNQFVIWLTEPLLKSHISDTYMTNYLNGFFFDKIICELEVVTGPIMEHCRLLTSKTNAQLFRA